VWSWGVACLSSALRETRLGMREMAKEVSFWVRVATLSWVVMRVLSWVMMGPWSSCWSMTIRVTPVSVSWFFMASETHRAPLYLGRREKWMFRVASWGVSSQEGGII